MSKCCLLCQQPLQQQMSLQQFLAFRPMKWEVLCERCQEGLGAYSAQACVCTGCGRPLVASGQGDRYQQIAWRNPMDQTQCYCEDCANWCQRVPLEWVRHQALFDYTPLCQEWLHRYKYLADSRLAQVGCTALQQYAKAHRHALWLVLPSSPTSLAERGFHATFELVAQAGLAVLCPFDYIGDGQKQAYKTKAERLALRQPFALNVVELTQLKAREWVLFDDVYTTGATLMAAKQLLYPLAEKQGVSVQSISLVRNSLNQY